MAINGYMMPPQNYGQYNALAPYQQRLDQMQQQWGGMPQQMMPQAPAAQVKGWPVSGEDEARKAMIELDGSVFWFPDINGGKVYSKQINTADFSPVFRVYQIAETPPAVPAPDFSTFAQKEDLEQLRGAIASMQEVIDQMSAPQKDGKK